MEQLCEVCSVNTSRKFAITRSENPIVACEDCLMSQVYSFQLKTGDWVGGPYTFPNECRDILNHVSTREQLCKVLDQSNRAIHYIKELSKVATTVHERLLSYLDSTQMETEEIAYLKTRNCLRQEKTVLALKKLVDDWKSFDFWKGELSPFGQTILDGPKGFFSLLVKFILPYPSLVFEGCLEPQSDPRTSVSLECFDWMMAGMNKAEQVKLSMALEEQVLLESRVEDRAALSFISASLLKHLSHVQSAQIEESWKTLISSVIDLPDLRENELTLIAIENSWKPAALNCIARLYYYNLLVFGSCSTDMKHAVRFMNRHFPTLQLYFPVEEIECAEEESEAFLKLILFFCCFHPNSFYRLCGALAAKLEERRKFEDAEVVSIERCKIFMAYFNIEARAIYSRSK